MITKFPSGNHFSIRTILLRPYLSVIAVRYGRVPKRSKGGDGIKKENGEGSEDVGLSPEQQMEERAREEKNIAIYDIVLKVTQVRGN